MRNIISWLSDEELSRTYSSSYWNDIHEEKTKEWWIEDGNYARCLNFLNSLNLISEFNDSLSYIRELPGDNIKVADLAAGIGWTSCLLSRVESISEVHAVEISKHRLEILFPHSVEMMGGNPGKLYRYLGSFYDTKFENGYFDVIYMSQAFHHADEPGRLLKECSRILRPGGRIILVGEHYIGVVRMMKRFLSELIKYRRLTFRFNSLFPSDNPVGDHFYRNKDYYSIFKAAGYSLRRKKTSAAKCIYIADKIQSGRSEVQA